MYKSKTALTTGIAASAFLLVLAPVPAVGKSYRGYDGYRSYHHGYGSPYRYNRSNGPYIPFRPPGHYRPHYRSYKPPKRKHESFSIYSTPGGGIGFSYYESKGRYGYY